MTVAVWGGAGCYKHLIMCVKSIHLNIFIELNYNQAEMCYRNSDGIQRLRQHYLLLMFIILILVMSKSSWCQSLLDFFFSVSTCHRWQYPCCHWMIDIIPCCHWMIDNANAIIEWFIMSIHQKLCYQTLQKQVIYTLVNNIIIQHSSLFFVSFFLCLWVIFLSILLSQL